MSNQVFNLNPSLVAEGYETVESQVTLLMQGTPEGQALIDITKEVNQAMVDPIMADVSSVSAVKAYFIGLAEKTITASKASEAFIKALCNDEVIVADEAEGILQRAGYAVGLTELFKSNVELIEETDVKAMAYRVQSLLDEMNTKHEAIMTPRCLSQHGACYREVDRVFGECLKALV